MVTASYRSDSYEISLGVDVDLKITFQRGDEEDALSALRKAVEEVRQQINFSRSGYDD